jgi:hypothetical protein
MPQYQFGRRAIPPKDVVWLTREDKDRLINLGLSLLCTAVLGFILGVAIFTRMPL